MSPSPAQPCCAAQLPGLGDGKAPTHLSRLSREDQWGRDGATCLRGASDLSALDQPRSVSKPPWQALGSDQETRGPALRAKLRRPHRKTGRSPLGRRGTASQRDTVNKDKGTDGTPQFDMRHSPV